MCHLYPIDTGKKIDEICQWERDQHNNKLSDTPTITMHTSDSHSMEIGFTFSDGHHKEIPISFGQNP
jgi:hypothetical protein